MSKPKILVTGATGKTGAIVVAELLAAGFPVRALVRGEDARSEVLRARGAEIAVADMADPEAIAASLEGVQRAYYLPPIDPAMLHGAAVFATAARDARLEHIVLMTQWLASPSHPALSTRQHWVADRIFRMIPNLGLTVINPGLFADEPYLAVMSSAAHLGVYPWLFGDSLNAPPSVDDIGRVAAAALMDPSRHAGRTYRPTGPALLSGQDIVAILSKVLERKVRLAPAPLPIFLKAARLDGRSLPVLSGMRYYIEDARRGAFAVGAPNDHVRQVTGRAPETFEAVARRHAALPRNQRTLGNLAREIAGFLAVPFVRVPIERFDAGLHAPRPLLPQLSVDSPTWRAEHGAERDTLEARRRARTTPQGPADARIVSTGR